MNTAIRNVRLALPALLALGSAACGAAGGVAGREGAAAVGREGAAAVGREGAAAAAHGRAPLANASSRLPAGWRRVRLPSGAMLPYPAGWQVVAGDPGSASAALVGRAGTIRAYLNATPAEGAETHTDWARFRLRHNAAEGDRDVRLVSARSDVPLGAGRASCVLDDYATSRSRYRELACLLRPADGRQATVLIAAAQPRAWAQERPLLDFALSHFSG